MIYLIEKAWIDSWENEIDSSKGYKPFGYTTNLEIVNNYSNSGFYTKEDCWSISEPMAKFRVSELKEIVS